MDNYENQEYYLFADDLLEKHSVEEISELLCQDMRRHSRSLVERDEII